MNKAVLVVFLTGFSLSLSLSAAEPTYVVQNVEDGDTVVVVIEGKPERVQLLGIDAPEFVANPKLKRDAERTGLADESLLALGAASTSHLRGLLPNGQHVQLQGQLKQRDRYGRISVNVIDASGQSINQAMVAQGYAIFLGRYPLPVKLKADLREAEAVALAERHGLWSSHRDVTLAWGNK